MCTFFVGLQDKLSATEGYCILNTDEGTSFLDEMSKKEVKHESDISLLNQLFDGKGDKATLAKGNERHVIDNATCITVAVQPQTILQSTVEYEAHALAGEWIWGTFHFYIGQTLQVNISNFGYFQTHLLKIYVTHVLSIYMFLLKILCI